MPFSAPNGFKTHSPLRGCVKHSLQGNGASASSGRNLGWASAYAFSWITWRLSPLLWKSKRSYAAAPPTTLPTIFTVGLSCLHVLILLLILQEKLTLQPMHCQENKLQFFLSTFTFLQEQLAHTYTAGGPESNLLGASQLDLRGLEREQFKASLTKELPNPLVGSTDQPKNRYLNFCRDFSLSDVPLPESTLCMLPFLPCKVWSINHLKLTCLPPTICIHVYDQEVETYFILGASCNLNTCLRVSNAVHPRRQGINGFLSLPIFEVPIWCMERLNGQPWYCYVIGSLLPRILLFPLLRRIYSQIWQWSGSEFNPHAFGHLAGWQREPMVNQCSSYKARMILLEWGQAYILVALVLICALLQWSWITWLCAQVMRALYLSSMMGATYPDNA